MNERLNVSNSHGVVLFVDIERSVPAASEFIGKQFQTKSRNQIYNRANMLNVQWPNHSLNLTEPAVDKFAARCWTDLGASDWNVRATKYMELAARRRRLARYR